MDIPEMPKWSRTNSRTKGAFLWSTLKAENWHSKTLLMHFVDNCNLLQSLYFIEVTLLSELPGVSPSGDERMFVS